MSLYAKLATAQATNHERLPNLPAGTYECMIEAAREIASTNPKHKGHVYFIADLRVVSGPRAGERTNFFATVVGAAFDDYAANDAAAIRDFAASSLGLDPKADATLSEDWGTILPGIVHKDQPVKGHVIRMSVSYKPKNEAELKFPIYGFQPVLENGAPKVLKAEHVVISRPVAKVPSVPAVPAAPALPPPPPPAPVVFPPAGWTEHPQAPGHFYKGNIVLSADNLRAAMAVGKA